MLPIFNFDRVDSTNAQAMRWAREGRGECAIVAACQTRGCGRNARPWLSPAGEGLWVTLLLRPKDLPASRAPGAVFVMALSMAEALSPYAPALIKWPNDLVLGGKKLAGMLSESIFSGERCACLALGSGVNLLQTQFPPELPQATSLLRETGVRLAPERLLEKYLARFEIWYRRWLEEGLAPVLAAIAPLSATLGRRVRIQGREGVAVGFDGDGALLWRVDGKVESLVAGDVSVRGEHGYV